MILTPEKSSKKTPALAPVRVIAMITAKLALTLIAGYRFLISPLFPNHCRYVPSCSHYARETITVHGVVRGGWLTLRRIMRCHPWGGSGYDPVPLPDDEKT